MNVVEVGVAVVLGAAVAAWYAGAPAAVPVVTGTLLLGVLTLAAVRPGLGWFGAARTRVDPRGVALTIDDGPHPVTTPALLRVLADAGVHATFFFLADRAAAHPELVRATRDAGHEIGLHGLTHSWGLTVWAPRRGAVWLGAGRAAVEAAGAGPITRFRPPFGVVSPRLVAAVRGAGLALTWCSLRTGDGVRIAPETLRRRLAAARPGDVVLIHDGNPVTAEVLPDVLAAWSRAGLRVGSVAELT